MKNEITTASAKAAPPIAVTGSQMLFDLTLNEWVAIATLIYIALQAFFLVRNEMRKRRK
jgi:hypothetical protein